MKFIRGFFAGILTLILMGLLIGIGLTADLKDIIMDTMNVVISDSLSDSLIDTFDEYTEDKISDADREKIKESISKNKTLNELAPDLISIIIDSITTGNTDIDLKLDEKVDGFLDDNEDIFKEYGITITKEERDAIKEALSSNEFKDTIEVIVKETRADLDGDTQVVLDAYKALTGPSLTITLVIIALVVIVLIIVLKGNIYTWFTNLAVSTLISGIIVGIGFPAFVDLVNIELEGDNFMLSASSFETYGYILIGVGIVSIVCRIVMPMVLKNRQVEVVGDNSMALTMDNNEDINTEQK